MSVVVADAFRANPSLWVVSTKGTNADVNQRRPAALAMRFQGVLFIKLRHYRLARKLRIYRTSARSA
jgi:hypothetical protein